MTAKRTRDGVEQCQVEWTGGGNSWIPATQCWNCEDAVAACAATPHQQQPPEPEPAAAATALTRMRPIKGKMDDQKMDKDQPNRKDNAKVRKVVSMLKKPVLAAVRAIAPDDSDGLLSRVMTSFARELNDDTRSQTNAGGAGALLIPAMRGNKPKKRRHLTAFFCDGVHDPMTGLKHTRKSLGVALGETVSGHEWRRARVHAISPGAGNVLEEQPLKRQRISTAKLQNIIQFFCRPAKTQRFAHGHLKRKFSTGEAVILDRVNLKKRRAVLAAEYLHEVDLLTSTDPDVTNIPSNEARCEQWDTVTHRRCMKATHTLYRNNGQKCKYTPSDACSASTIYKISSTLFGDEVKSMQGLDDTILECREQNYAAMRELVDTIATFLLSVVDDQAIIVSTRDALKDDIEKSDDYYRCEFAEHLERESTTCTHCLSCGFNTGLNKIACRHRSTHSADCVDCNRAAGLFPRIEALIEKCMAFTADSEVVEDDVLEWGAEIQVCKYNWAKLVGHLARAESEERQDDLEIDSLPYHTALLQSDFKQRLLESYQREGQKKYYAQQTAAVCLGWMVISHKRRPGGCGVMGCTRAEECLGPGGKLRPRKVIRKKSNIHVAGRGKSSLDGRYALPSNTIPAQCCCNMLRSAC